MTKINHYYTTELTDTQISENFHRSFVGGYWDELGKLQLDFMLSKGLMPYHNLLDIGCGALRAGIHFIDYLDKNKYYGTDINRSLIKAGYLEIDKSNLTDKQAVLAIDANFCLSQFFVQFDYAIAQSVFTHLYANHIIHCLIKTKMVLNPRGKLYASFLEAPQSGYIDDITHGPGGVISHYDADPFHYSVEEIGLFAKIAGMNVDYVGDWGHPRQAKMLCFTP